MDFFQFGEIITDPPVIDDESSDYHNHDRKLSVKSISNHISLNASLAASLQVAAHVKPGNVHRYHDFRETRLEHYLSSAVLLNNPIVELATRGILTERELIDIDEVDMGWIIAEAAKENAKWHHGGMTNLGMLFLYSPIALAAGFMLSEADQNLNSINFKELPKIAMDFLDNTTPEDTVNVITMLYHLKTEVYPMSNIIGISLPESITDVLEEEINLLEFFKVNSKKNLIFDQIQKSYSDIFSIGFSAFEEALNESLTMIDAISHTYITLLSTNLDSLVYRKYGKDEALKIMQKAKNIMDNGGFLTSKGRILTYELDKYLQRPDSTINPGAMADLTSTVTFLATLKGYRP